MQNFEWTVSKVKEFTEYLGETSGNAFMKVVRDLIKFDPFSGHKFYIFSFVKLQNKERFHQPRLTKPEPIPGGTLLRVDPKNPDQMELLWTLPSQEQFGLYKYSKALADQFVHECIITYLNYPKKLMRKEADDVSDEQARQLYLAYKQRISKIDKQIKANSSFEGASQTPLMAGSGNHQ